MNEKNLQGMVLRIVLTELAKTGERFVPVSSSNRHVHLCQADVERLFGEGYQLTRMRDLAQPGQFACNESVTMECEKGKLSLRVVGPARKETQIELSYTDCFKLGVKPVLRMSGETAGTPGCTLSNGERRVTIDHGVIVAARHLHMSKAEAEGFGLQDGDVVTLEVEGPRAAVLNNVAVRSGDAHSLEAHIDKDEANACGVTDGQLCRIRLASPVSQSPAPVQAAPAIARPAPSSPPPATRAPELSTYQPGRKPAPAPEVNTYAPAKGPEIKTTLLDLSTEPRRLITETDVIAAAEAGHKLIRYGKDAILTPLARDAAAARGIELIQLI
ncbi:MAG TPA: phosphate propanoyltransferase [Candidatus Limiplasma sp.]|nr:phosphate propanoyltransferase [Candidatus Limiplasma sp.]HPS81462.1 phosphate propanoyltransferase [Candidatus Limiplasma sp.]